MLSFTYKDTTKVDFLSHFMLTPENERLEVTLIFVEKLVSSSFVLSFRES